MLCENEAKIKWLYEGETAILGLHQMGNEMKKVGNRWSKVPVRGLPDMPHHKLKLIKVV